MSKFQSISLPTLSDSATMKEVENESRKMGLDILNKLNSVADAQYPVGYVYTQYPGTSDPATLFGGTWLNITSLYAGLFFRAEGGSSLAFNAGNQLDAFQGHWHGIPTFGIVPASGSLIPQSNGGGASGATATGAVTDGTNGTPRTASETRPVNTTIRIWQRSGGTLTTTTGTSVVTGIYDSGTNSNGSWIRFTDGTMMCWYNTGSTAIAVTTAGAQKTYTFPIAFISLSSLFVAGTGNPVADVRFSVTGGVSSTTTCNIFITTLSNQNVTYLGFNAIGNWK